MSDLFSALYEEIDKRLKDGALILAIDGGSGSGKSTLAAELQERYGCALFHMDDFFLRVEQRTPERYAEAGGNVDRERFLDEVLIPLSRGETVVYRPFNCALMSLGDEVKVEPSPLTVIEGAYSMHPELAGYYGLSVFLDITPELQRERILSRNGEDKAKTFFERWIPFENRYFAEADVKSRCDMTFHLQKETI